MSFFASADIETRNHNQKPCTRNQKTKIIGFTDILFPNHQIDYIQKVVQSRYFGQQTTFFSNKLQLKSDPIPMFEPTANFSLKALKHATLENCLTILIRSRDIFFF